MRSESTSQRPDGPSRRGLALAVAAAVVAAALLLAAWALLGSSWWGDDEPSDSTADGPSDAAPWGLTEIEMPDTEAEVVAVMEALPVIDGHRPAGLHADGSPYAVSYDGGEPSATPGFTAVPTDTPDAEPIPETVQQLAAEHEADGFTVEASAFDPEGRLVWVALARNRTHQLIWAEPEGSWIFALEADSPGFRVELVHAFIAAAGG